MLVEHEGRAPVVDRGAWVAPTAVLCGDVRVAAGARVLWGAVLTDDGGPVTIGEQAIVMENALLRGRDGHPVTIGANVVVGPHAHVNGARVADDAFLATGVALFPGARVGRGAEIRINAVVHVGSAVADGETVPIGWVAVGDPARILSPERHEEIWAIQRELDFPGVVLGVERDAPDLPARAAARYSELFGRHRDDRVIG
jgi:carbonic anhydrase/acetyltransferase-like protein (isoleucine patch superfamily)